jgi:hypothetical protein
MNNSFVYCWTDHLTGKLYVGSHKGSIDDGYVCSSKYMMEEYNKRPQDFTRQIIAEGQFDDIRSLEISILKAENVKLNELYYNRSTGNNDFYVKQHTEEAKQKMRAKKLGVKRGPHSEEHKQKIAESIKKMGSHSDERKQNMSKAKLGKKQPNVSLANMGRIPWNKGLKNVKSKKDI